MIAYYDLYPCTIYDPGCNNSSGGIMVQIGYDDHVCLPAIFHSLIDAKKFIVSVIGEDKYVLKHGRTYVN